MRKILVADLYTLSLAAPDLVGEVKVNEECRRLPVVSDQVAHQDVADIIVDDHAIPAITIAGNA